MDAEKRTKIIKLAIAAVVCLFLIDWLARSLTGNKVAELPTPTVVVQKPVTEPITDYITQTGTMVAYNSVNLVARVEGYLQGIEFVDGSFVKKGQTLFVIEPLPYAEKVKSAEAVVVVQKATHDYDKAEYERQKRMYQQNATSLNNVEKWFAQSEGSNAEIDKAVADAELAKINYSYTHVLSPFDGRIGRHLVDLGNLVGHGEATNLATVQQIDPIYVYFNLNELDLIALREAARVRGFKPDDINKIPVYVQMQSETGFPHEGKLDFVNTGLNASTGTMEFRALLSNKDLVLLPGLFVKVRIPTNKPKPELTLPDVAVQYDQIGAYVYTVGKDNIVVQKRVTVGPAQPGIKAITKGLTPDDNVIISGLQYATPGSPVAPKTEKPAS